MQIVEFLLVLPVLLFSMVAHEYAHGYAALRQGDPTAYHQGRLTLNPLKHIDLWMTVLLPVMVWVGSGGRMIFGGAKPIPVNPQNYRDVRRGDIIVSSAGIVANLFLAAISIVLAAVVGLVGLAAGGELLAPIQRMMFWGLWFNLLLANFNLVPIPPLDGSHLFKYLLPPELALQYRKISRYGVLILIGMLFFYPRGIFYMLLPAITTLRWSLDLLRPMTLQPFGLF